MNTSDQVVFEHLDLACMQAFARVAGGRCGLIPRKFWKSDRLHRAS